MVVSVGQARTADWWEEWVIRCSILLLIAIGVGAIWGAPIRDWLDSLGGSTTDTSGAHAPRTPTGGTL